MISRWLSWFNCSLLALAMAFALCGVVYWLRLPHALQPGNLTIKANGLPKGAFELPEIAYTQAGDLVLSLEEAPPALRLPDLKSQLIYYGKNGRPDAGLQQTVLHFSLTGNHKTIASSAPGEKLYLIFDRKATTPRYTFSPNNEKTSLWIEGVAQDNEAMINVTMENDKGEFIREPESLAQFKLPEKEFIRYGGVSWEIGNLRVDGTLLARQRAKWYGMDRFLEKHGGDDYKDLQGKHRIDFSENDDLYSVFVKAGDCLIWDGKRWIVITPGEGSIKHPLLVVKKIDERLMTFELWDVEGKGKILMNLLKSSEPWAVQNVQTLQHMFKFLGAKTKTQCVFEINRERVILRPSDWMLLTVKGWKKLATEEDIDNYVKRKTSGTLFVFDGISRKDEKQVMFGTLYSPSRHESQQVELALQVKKPARDLKDKIKEAREAADAAQRAKNMHSPESAQNIHKRAQL